MPNTRPKYIVDKEYDVEESMTLAQALRAISRETGRTTENVRYLITHHKMPGGVTVYRDAVNAKRLYHVRRADLTKILEYVTKFEVKYTTVAYADMKKRLQAIASKWAKPTDEQRQIQEILGIEVEEKN